MIEKTFENRVPTYPNRVTLTPVAGQTNTYDMVRADEPVKEGTPIDKAAFDSIIHSRLTGRYYMPTVTRTAAANRTGLTVSPLPTSGWVLSSDNLKATSGAYTVEANSLYSNSYTPDKAFDGDTSTEYRSDASGEIMLTIKLPSPIKLLKYKLSMRPSNYTYAVTTEVKGSNNGTSWTTLYTTTTKPDTLTEFTLTSTGDYSQYRFIFKATETGINVREIQFSLYDVNTYTNALTVDSGFPTSWTNGQRVTIYTPSVNTLAVTANTLNGVTVSTILEASKYYELRYTGSVFVAREV